MRHEFASNNGNEMNMGSPSAIISNFSPQQMMSARSPDKYYETTHGTQQQSNIPDFIVNSGQLLNNNGTWDSRPNFSNLSPNMYSHIQSQEMGEQYQEVEDNTQNIYAKSAYNNNDSGSEVSRKTFQRINLGERNGSRGNMTTHGSRGNMTAQKQSQVASPEKMGVKNLEGINLNNWNAETMSKILYGLLQQLELVKYLTQETKSNLHQQQQQAGERIIDTILKNICNSESNFTGKRNSIYQARLQAMDTQSILQIFTMLNNLSLFYMKQNLNRESFVLLQCAVQICKHSKEVVDQPNLLSTLYNNLSLYHARGQGKLSQRQANKYVEGAITAQYKFNQHSETSFLNLAISFNNKAVIELQNQKHTAAHECSIKAIQLVEPKVFGIITSGLINNRQRDSNDVYAQFQRMLEVLLIAYYNLAATQDGQLESKNIYLKGLQLSYQYLNGGQNSQMFKRFYLKYSRKYYQILNIKSQKKVGNCTFLDKTARLPIPDILPLDCIQEDTNERIESITNEKYQDFIKSFNQLEVPQKMDNSNVQMRPQQQQQQNDGFTLQDSATARTRMTHMQNQMEGTGVSLHPRIMDSAATLPPNPPSQIHHNSNDMNIKAQRSEIVNSHSRHNSEDPDPGYIQMDNQVQQVMAQNQVIAQNALSYQLNHQQQNSVGVEQLKLDTKDTSINRAAGDSSNGQMQTQTPQTYNRTEQQSYNSPSMTNTAKFGRTLDLANSHNTHQPYEFENKMNEEKNKMKQEMQMQQQEFSRQLQEQQQHQMQMLQQMMMQQNQISSSQQASIQNQTPPQQQLQQHQLQPEIDLRKFQVFDNLNENQRQLIQQNLQKQVYQQGQYIIQEGQTGDQFFLIDNGQVEVTKQTRSCEERQVRILQNGDHFGEVALLNIVNTRTMSVKVMSQTEVYALDKRSFEQVQNSIERFLKKEYNNEFEAKLHNEQLQARLYEEREALERQKEQLKKKEDELKQQQQNAARPPQPAPMQKMTSSGSQPQANKKETGNLEQVSLVQESLNRKLSKKIEGNNFTDVWMTSNSIKFGKRDSTRNLEMTQNKEEEEVKESKPNNNNAATARDEVQSKTDQAAAQAPAIKTLSKTNLSEEPPKENTSRSKMQVENKEMPSQTPRNDKSRPGETFADFHFEKLNEQDENDLGFDDLMRQHQSLLHSPSEGVRNDTLVNFEHLVNSYDYLEDDQIRNQFWLDNLQNNQDGSFKWTPLQIKALIYLREHHRLYSPQNIWKFNAKLLEQIKNEKEISCSQIIQQQIGQELKLYNFKVNLKAVFNGDSSHETLDEAVDQRKYLENIASNIKVYLQAEVDQNQIQLSKGYEPVTPQVEISFLELQTVLYMFSDISSVDPNPCVRDCFSSVPFYQLDNFQSFCEVLLFKYVEVFLGDDESFDQAKSQTSRVCPYSIDFKELPSGLFVIPHKITFLQDTGEENADGSHTPVQQMSQSDNLQGQASIHSDRGLSQFNNALNCQIDIFHIKNTNFKIVISPSFDLSMILLRRSLIQQNMDNEEALAVQPESLCQLHIDLQFVSLEVQNDFFNSIQADQMKFQSTGATNGSQYQKISNSMEFYDAYFKKFIVELDKILCEEYKGLMIKEPSEQDEQQGENMLGNQLNNHQKFFALIINKKVAYIQLRVEAVIDKAKKYFKQRMVVILKNPQPTADYAHDKNKNLKIIGLYCDQTTNNTVKRCLDHYETSARYLSKQFGQELDIGFYSQVKHYTLCQLCHILTYCMKLVVEVEESSDGSGLGSSGSGSFGDSDSDSDSDDDDDSNASKKNKVQKEAIGKLNVFKIVCVMYKRHVRIYNEQPFTITSEFLVSNETKKILGIKFTAYDSISNHESGVFLLIDQSKWPKLEEHRYEVDRFYTKFSVMPLLKEVGINYMLDKHLFMEPHQNPVYKDKMCIKLSEPRLNAQRNMLDVVRDLEQNQNINAQQKNRILSQMPPDKSSISFLERFVNKEMLMKMRTK